MLVLKRITKALSVVLTFLTMALLSVLIGKLCMAKAEVLMAKGMGELYAMDAGGKTAVIEASIDKPVFYDIDESIPEIVLNNQTVKIVKVNIESRPSGENPLFDTTDDALKRAYCEAHNRYIIEYLKSGYSPELAEQAISYNVLLGEKQ